MKVIVTGGGTGGHIYPALAIAEQIKKMDHSAEIIYMGSINGLEKELALRNNLEYIAIDVAPLNKRISLGTVRSLWRVFKGFLTACAYVRRAKPDVIVGTGGYVSGSVCMAGVLCGSTVAIHEQNAFPGMTNKILSRFVDLVMITFEPARAHFKTAKRIEVTGLPVIEAFINTTRDSARKKLGLTKDEWVVLSVGGSNGALALNECMLEAYTQLGDIKELTVYHVTGRRYYEEIIDELKAKPPLPIMKFEVLPFINDMPTYLSAADLVVSRAGASTIVEIMTTEVPAIVVPSPNVANNHQYYNALCVEEAGQGVVIEERELTAERIVGEIRKTYLKGTTEKTNGYKQKSAHAIEHIGELLYEVSSSKKRR